LLSKHAKLNNRKEVTMTQATRQICLGCNEILFGIAWVGGQLVIYTNCICNGPTYVLLQDAIKDLGPEKKKVVKIPQTSIVVH
jgi:hypothetical protein